MSLITFLGSNLWQFFTMTKEKYSLCSVVPLLDYWDLLFAKNESSDSKCSVGLVCFFFSFTSWIPSSVPLISWCFLLHYSFWRLLSVMWWSFGFSQELSHIFLCTNSHLWLVLIRECLVLYCFFLNWIRNKNCMFIVKLETVFDNFQTYICYRKFVPVFSLTFNYWSY